MGEVVQEGMTLRDYFAIHSPEPSQAQIHMEASLDKGRNPYNDSYKSPLRSMLQIQTQLRYQYADAMLAERSKS